MTDTADDARPEAVGTTHDTSPEPAKPTRGARPEPVEPAQAARPEPVDPTLPYETARDELRQIVATLEQGDLTLEESLLLWERGEDLARHCESLLRGARERLDAALAVESPPPGPPSTGE